MVDRLLIKVRNLSKSYVRGKQTVPVLLNINLDVKRGDYVSLMGPSGSGKSTLLNLLAGIDKPTSGSLKVRGREISEMSEQRLAAWRASHVGFIFQFYNLMPVMTAFENVELPLLLTKLDRAARRRHVEAALGVVGLKDRMSHRPNELSGGQQQRVAIARAIVTDATLIVADEPTGDLDRAAATEVLALLRQLNTDFGKTIVMVTHDPECAAQARKRIYLNKGELVAGPQQ